MEKGLDIVLLILSVAIAAHVVIYHAAPWILIALYWTANAVKNGRKMK